jgi:hypothetical protein
MLTSYQLGPVHIARYLDGMGLYTEWTAPSGTQFIAYDNGQVSLSFQDVWIDIDHPGSLVDLLLLLDCPEVRNLVQLESQGDTIMKILGHSSIDITMNIYGHIFDEQEGEALADVSNRLHPGYNPQDGSEDNGFVKG